MQIPGNPVVYLAIDPLIPKLSVRTAVAKNTVPNVAAYRNITSGIRYWKDQSWCEVSIEGSAVKTAYPVVCDIADRLQLNSHDFSRAVSGALHAWEALLAPKNVLSEERQTGLYGELLVLRELLKGMLPTLAIASWRGPGAEEHDFGLQDFDLEVKATTTEDRLHWISSATQLMPSLNRPLWFASIMLTDGGAGGATLPELVAKLEASLPAPDVGTFRTKLHDAGWRNDDAQLYDRRLRLRTAPFILPVDQAFPAITADGLVLAGIESSRIKRLKYMVDLTGLTSTNSLPSLLTHVGEMT